MRRHLLRSGHDQDSDETRRMDLPAPESLRGGRREKESVEICGRPSGTDAIGLVASGRGQHGAAARQRERRDLDARW